MDGDESLEILDCETCERDRETACGACPLANGEQPRLSGRAKWMVTLYRRVMAYQALPNAGGLLDQDEGTMQMLDVIHEELGAAKDGKGGGGKVLHAAGTMAGKGR